jgi:hypothetical protein
MYEYSFYKYIEFVIFSLYLIFIFLSIQMWFLWKDVDKDQLVPKTFVNDLFFKKNSFYVFSFGTILMIHQFFEDKYFKIFEMLALVSVILFAFSWYSTLKPYAHKKALPQELNNYENGYWKEIKRDVSGAKIKK